VDLTLNPVASYLQDLLEHLKISIRREHALIPARSYRADEEIGIRTLHAPTAASVEESRRQLVIFSLHSQIREGAQPFA
jgi:hypothetical protein